MKLADILGDYRLIRKLGEGGMSEVWLAEDSRIRHQVAVKVLHAQYARNPKIRKRLEIEAQALARLKHPNIVGIHHYIEHGDDVALVMEYVEGMNLDDYVRKEPGPLPEEKLRAIFLQILDGIGFAHQQGIVHRDIKPSNFMITADGTVKVLDFGIAKVLEEGAEKLTRTGMRMGTTAYMSPEQVNADAVDHLSDIYSLGVTLFFLATGRGVYEGEESDYKVQRRIVQEPLPAASGVYPGVPGYVERVIARATAKRKEERFQACGEMRAAFERREDDASILPPKPAAPPAPVPPILPLPLWRRPWIWGVIGLLLVAEVVSLFTVSGMWGGGGSDPKESSSIESNNPTLEKARLDSIAYADSVAASNEARRKRIEDPLKTDSDQKAAKVKEIEEAKLKNVIRELEANMVLVQGGSFKMGSHEGSFETPIHEVRLSSYYMSKTEVTQAQ